MFRRRRPETDERGETLLELIIAIAILGICVVAIGSGIAVSITISAIHRKQATALDSLHNYAEVLQSNYTPCTATSTPNYAGSLAQLTPPGFATPTAVVDYWVPTSGSFTHSCPPGGDTGLQQVTLKLVNTAGNVSESLVVDLRSLS